MTAGNTSAIPKVNAPAHIGQLYNSTILVSASSRAYTAMRLTFGKSWDAPRDEKYQKIAEDGPLGVAGMTLVSHPLGVLRLYRRHR